MQSGARLLLPYSGLVSTVTGARRHDQQIIEAITAGSVRRGYLKGLGEAYRLPLPAAGAAARTEGRPTQRRDQAPGRTGPGPRLPVWQVASGFWQQVLRRATQLIGDVSAR